MVYINIFISFRRPDLRPKSPLYWGTFGVCILYYWGDSGFGRASKIRFLVTPNRTVNDAALIKIRISYNQQSCTIYGIFSNNDLDTKNIQPGTDLVRYYVPGHRCVENLNICWGQRWQRDEIFPECRDLYPK